MSECVCRQSAAECVCEPPNEGCNMSIPIERFQDPGGGIAELTERVLREERRGRFNETVLSEASRITDRDRKEAYAHPSVNFDRIARMWSVILGCEVTPEQHALCMIAVKLSRLVETPGHRDSLVDVAGYARTIEVLYDEPGR